MKNDEAETLKHMLSALDIPRRTLSDAVGIGHSTIACSMNLNRPLPVEVWLYIRSRYIAAKRQGVYFSEETELFYEKMNDRVFTG